MYRSVSQNVGPTVDVRQTHRLSCASARRAGVASIAPIDSVPTNVLSEDLVTHLLVNATVRKNILEPTAPTRKWETNTCEDAKLASTAMTTVYVSTHTASACEDGSAISANTHLRIGPQCAQTDVLEGGSVITKATASVCTHTPAETAGMSNVLKNAVRSIDALAVNAFV